MEPFDIYKDNRGAWVEKTLTENDWEEEWKLHKDYNPLNVLVNQMTALKDVFEKTSKEMKRKPKEDKSFKEEDYDESWLEE